MGIFSKISSIFTGRRELDAVTSESLSDALILADIAPDLSESLVGKLRARTAVSEDDAKQILFDAMLPIVNKLAVSSYQLAYNTDKPANCYLLTANSKSPTVILVIGVNGAGKTTTIGKMARQWHDAGKSVVIGAADTFRAAASEQLAEWANRAGAVLITGAEVTVPPFGGTETVKQFREGDNTTQICPPTGPQNRAPTPPKGGIVASDPATVAYKAVEYGIKNNADFVVIDTAGRLHNRADLMDELAKITRVIKKLIPDAPHESLLVLDANTGQNALNQIEYFDKVAQLTGLIITKMDSTSKGGFLVTYAHKSEIRNLSRQSEATTDQKSKAPLPVYAIGYGEKIGDLRPFDAKEYLNKLLDI